jgi:hypothetical protein
VSWKDFVSKLNDELMHKKETMLKGKLLVSLCLSVGRGIQPALASPGTLALELITLRLLSVCGNTVIVVVTGTFLAWALLVAAVLGYAVCCVRA